MLQFFKIQKSQSLHANDVGRIRAYHQFDHFPEKIELQLKRYSNNKSTPAISIFRSVSGSRAGRS